MVRGTALKKVKEESYVTEKTMKKEQTEKGWKSIIHMLTRGKKNGK